MRKFVMVVDSTADLPLELRTKFDIKYCQMNINYEGKEYKDLDKIIEQNATYKKASIAAEQQLKQLRRKAVVIVNDDRYKL